MKLAAIGLLVLAFAVRSEQVSLDYVQAEITQVREERYLASSKPIIYRYRCHVTLETASGEIYKVTEQRLYQGRCKRDFVSGEMRTLRIEVREFFGLHTKVRIEG